MSIDPLHTRESPPTCFLSNKFITVFQGIADVYGVAKYQEANPGVYTIVMILFLFAVMVGDWDRGICLLLATLYLTTKVHKLSNQKLGDITEMTLGGGYVILMMSVVSIYTGSGISKIDAGEGRNRCLSLLLAQITMDNATFSSLSRMQKFGWGELNTTGDISLSVSMIGADLFYIQKRSESCKEEEFEFLGTNNLQICPDFHLEDKVVFEGPVMIGT